MTFYCHECKGREPARTDDNDLAGYVCDACGETILCDECGRPWTDDHECGAS